jgi:hypothetical protein
VFEVWLELEEVLRRKNRVARIRTTSEELSAVEGTENAPEVFREMKGKAPSREASGHAQALMKSEK